MADLVTEEDPPAVDLEVETDLHDETLAIEVANPGEGRPAVDLVVEVAPLPVVALEEATDLHDATLVTEVDHPEAVSVMVEAHAEAILMDTKDVTRVATAAGIQEDMAVIETDRDASIRW